MIITTWRLLFSWKGRNEQEILGKWKSERKYLKLSMWRWKQEENNDWPGSPPMYGQLFLLLFGSWGRRQRQGLREEEDRKGGENDRAWKRKLPAVSHTAVEVEPLARILLVMSTIWNVESLPLSALRTNGVVQSLCVPSLQVCQQTKRVLEATTVWTRLCWQDTQPAWKWDPWSRSHPTGHNLDSGIWAWKKQRQLQSSAEMFRRVFPFPYMATEWRNHLN